MALAKKILRERLRTRGDLLVGFRSKLDSTQLHFTWGRIKMADKLDALGFKRKHRERFKKWIGGDKR